MLMAIKIETPVEKAERILPQIDSIFLSEDRLSSGRARKLIAEGKAALRGLELFVGKGEPVLPEHKRLMESLRISLSIARREG